MPTVDLRFAPEIRLALEHCAHAAEPTPDGPGATPAPPPEDADAEFAALWREAIAAGLDADLGALRRLLARETFGRGPLTLDTEEALGALRGFTALRLLLRATALRELSDARLEAGDVDRRTLDAATRHGYACYGALGEIQDALCAALDA